MAKAAPVVHPTTKNNKRNRSRPSHPGTGSPLQNVEFMNELFHDKFLDWLKTDQGKKAVEEKAKEAADQHLEHLKKEGLAKQSPKVVEMEKQSWIRTLDANGLYKHAEYIRSGNMDYEPSFGDRVTKLWGRNITVGGVVITGIALVILATLWEAIAANADLPRMGWFDGPAMLPEGTEIAATARRR